MALKPRAPRKAPKIISVFWDDTRRRYVATDEQGTLHGLSTDFNTAIGSAVGAANLASKEGVQVTVKVPGKNGKLRTEYIARPAPH